MKSSFVAILISCATLAFSQTPPPGSTSSHPPAPSTGSATGSEGLKVRGPEAVAQQDPNRVVATINGTQITAKQAEDMLKPLSPEIRQKYASNLPMLLRQLYMQEQFTQQATKLNLDQQEPWKGQLKIARENILTQAYLTHAAKTSTAPMPDSKQYFDSHPNDFDQAKLSSIFIYFAPPGTPATAGRQSRTEEEARTKADDLEKKLKGNADFENLARTESDNPKTANEVTLLSSATNIPPSIKDAIFKLQPGQVSEPIRTSNGFYIFKLISRHKQTFEEARPEIVQKLQAERNQTILNQEFAKYNLQVKDPDFFNASTAPSGKIPSLARPSDSQQPRAPGVPRPATKP